MQENGKSGEFARLKNLRRCILEHLYARFREVPYAPVELHELEEECLTSREELNWNLVYLEKKGHLELGKSVEAPPYIACSVSITADGIDLLEDPGLFDELFPNAAG
jgi:hypothetical protein